MFGTLTDRIISSVIAVGSLIFPFISGIDPLFTNVNLNRSENALVLSMYLDNCYTEELDNILMSGQTITLRFQAELYEKNRPNVILSRQFYHTLRYNPLEKKYTIYYSENERAEICNTLRQAHKYFSVVRRVEIIRPDDLVKNHTYYLQLSAYLEPVTFIGQKTDFNLMLYWNNKKPTIRTEEFDISIFYH